MKDCAKCGKKIDRGACGELYAVVTFYDDLANKKLQKKRFYLCDSCSFQLNAFMKFPASFQEVK